MILQDSHRYKQNIEELDTNTSHIQILSKIPNASKVLDVGCACGDLGAYLCHHKECIVYGMEYDSNSIAMANGTNAYVHIEQIDLNNLETMPDSFPNDFDRIVFGDVLEHLNQPKETIAHFLPQLKEGGRMIISLPNIAHGSITSQLLANKFTYMDYGVLDRTHVRFFTSESIATLTASQGLKIISATRTIWDLPGLHPYTPAHMLPASVLAHIAANPHSYVLQYVFEAIPFKQTQTELKQHNLYQLDTFTQEEEQIIASFRGDSFLSDMGQEDIPAFYQLPLSEKICHIGPYLKPWLKKRTPRSVWNFLKGTRNLGRVVWRRIRPVGDEKIKNRYINQVMQLPVNNSTAPYFIEIAKQPPVIPQNCPKTIAFYLPQFHPFVENDAWWGRGFTEWTNVTKAVPQFVGHYQPRLPIDLGFYDLRVPEVLERQLELAKLYGIYGFCFHYYWFSGKRLMERPLFDFLKRSELNMPFCLCWANEPWSRRWDGSEDELLIKQDLLKDDDFRFVDDLLPFIRDPRYITIEGRPLVIIYRPHFWTKERVLILVENMRAQAIQHGFKDLYLVMALSHDFYDDPRDWGFDAGVEFPPHLCGSVPQAQGLSYANKKFCGSVHDMRELVNIQENMRPSPYTTFKTVFPSWDNTARKLDNAFIFHHASPALYSKWLSNALNYTHMFNDPKDQFVFINAWNEWAEGAYLEPDRKYGYAFLQATAKTMANFDPTRTTNL